MVPSRSRHDTEGQNYGLSSCHSPKKQIQRISESCHLIMLSKGDVEKLPQSRTRFETKAKAVSPFPKRKELRSVL